MSEDQPSPEMGQVREWLAQTSGTVVLPAGEGNRVDFEVEPWRVSSAARPASYVRRGIRPPVGVTGTIEWSPSREGQLRMSVIAHNDVGLHPALAVWLTMHAASMAPAVAEIVTRAGSTSVDVTLAVESVDDRKQTFDDGVEALLAAARHARFIASNPPTVDLNGQWTDGFTDMVKTLTEADLPVPPVPESMRPLIVRCGRWFWSTVGVSGAKMYEFRARRGRDADEVGDMFALAHVGHGINSYFLSYALRYRGEEIAERYPWAGAYSDRERERSRIAAGFEELRTRVRELDQPADEP